MSQASTSPRQLDRSFRMIYPVYIDKSRTVVEGRKISLAQCVDKPTALEIAEACASLKLPTHLETARRHPTEPFVYGRVRVKIIGNDGQPLYKHIPTMLSLMREVCVIINAARAAKKPAPQQNKKK